MLDGGRWTRSGVDVVLGTGTVEVDAEADGSVADAGGSPVRPVEGEDELDRR
jgi:hypothetical protein